MNYAAMKLLTAALRLSIRKSTQQYELIRVNELLDECDQLCKIIAQSIVTTKGNKDHTR